jgi:hypothetical protein
MGVGAHEAEPGSRRRKLERVLDQALDQTFPASDPFSVGQITGTEPPSRPVDRKAPRIDARQGRPRRRSRPR